MAGATQGERIVVLGEPGTGKTLLLQVLDRSLRAQDFNVSQLRPGDALAAPAEAAILLVDEADLLDVDELGWLCSLPNPIIMTGLPGLHGRLPPCPHPYHAKRLERLSPEDIARFVRARLDASETVHAAFAPKAVLALMRQSAGLFRLVTILAGAALFLAEQRGSSEVTVADVDEAASLRAGAFEPSDEDTRPLSTVAEPARSRAELEPVGPESWRPARRTLAVVGWTGWLSASLGVVMGAIVLARASAQYPVLQIVADSPAALTASSPVPMTAPFLVPVPPRQPEVLAATPAPLPVTAPPQPAMISPASAPEPSALPSSLAKAAPSEVRPLETAEAERPQTLLVFSGPITNDTMGQTGQLSLRMITNPAGGHVGAVFHASHGLIGTGVLNGAIEKDGKVRLAGHLMMGRNEFDCQLYATIEGDRLMGEATFVHLLNRAPAHSRFILSKL